LNARCPRGLPVRPARAVAFRPPPVPRVPRLDDDGHAVTLDLHGARVADAERLVQDVVGEAARHGRSTLRIVHGHSTTDPLGGSRTIKTALLDLLDGGAFGPHVVSALRGEGHVLVGLAPAPRPAPGRLRLSDFRQP
jgi:hypothetical protein